MHAQHSLTFESFGLVAEVVSDDRELFDGVPDALPPGWRPSSGGGQALTRFGVMRDGTITLDGATVASTEVWSSPLSVLASAVRHHLAEHAPAHVFVHAGVVSVGAVGIVIPGSSMSGKSTLVSELVRAGATYYSDEYAVVDAEGMIHPYPKPLAIRFDPRSRRFLGSITVPEAQIGAHPVRAGLIVVTRYEPGARWRPNELSPGEGALALFEHIVVARTRPGDAIAAARRVAHDARIIGGPRGEAPSVAAAVLRLAGLSVA